MLVSDLKNYKDSLYAAFSRDISEFEKNFLLISGGILAFSITFIKEIIKIEQATSLLLLFLGWAFIIVAIGLMMFTFLRSAVYCDNLWKVTDDFLTTNQLYDETTALTVLQIDFITKQINTLFYESKLFLRRLRYGAVSFFLLGLILFSSFVGTNLVKEKRSKQKPNSSKIISIKIDSLEFISTDSSLNFKYDNHKIREAKP